MRNRDDKLRHLLCCQDFAKSAAIAAPSNKLRKAVAFANFGKLRFKNEHEQQIWQECSRLITNCIIIYNATILSSLLAHRQSIGDIEGAVALKKVSLVAWQHINLHGRYEFTKNTDPIDMNEIIRTLARVPVREI